MRGSRGMVGSECGRVRVTRVSERLIPAQVVVFSFVIDGRVSHILQMENRNIVTKLPLPEAGEQKEPTIKAGVAYN